jgi:hypothetical protein
MACSIRNNMSMLMEFRPSHLQSFNIYITMGFYVIKGGSLDRNFSICLNLLLA